MVWLARHTLAVLEHWVDRLRLHNHAAHAWKRFARAVEKGRGDFDEADIWTLGQEALGLLDALLSEGSADVFRRRVYAVWSSIARYTV